ncbi:MAG TPA: oxygen-independent coproporphyrinogen III oxidase [Magnetospirillaceae bacterium]|jgi:oxygen-independent coproporphyrinogen-3 oxidase
MRADLAAKYDLRVPRYTSYPTAPHFGPSVGAAAYGKWLGELPTDMPLSLYLHIAYCAEMCWFCACNLKITKKYEPVTDYMDCLWREIELVAERLPTTMTARHVHFGGGTPTILTPEDFTATVDRLRKSFAFARDAEIAVELDPRTTDREYVRAMVACGVTRASMGVQDFNAKVQEAINRIQPYDITARVFDWLREDGVTEINMDLIYGLPYQTVDTVVETIDQAIGLAPRRIALFGYAHVPWMKKHQTLIPEAALPDMTQRWQQYDAAAARLAESGYVAVGLDHFARKDDEIAKALTEGRLHRNFQGYTTDAAPALIGLGASGIGSLPQGYIVNDGDIRAYKQIIRQNSLATARGIALSDDDRLRRTVIERLMCDLRIDLDAMGETMGFDPAQFDGDIAALADMEADGLLTRAGRKIAMTDEGRPLVRAACARFDRYLKAGETRHSKAV